MLESDYQMTEQAFLEESGAPNARYAGDDKLFVKFHTVAIPDVEKSAEEGRPIYKETVQIQIMQPGNKDSIIDRPITEEDKRRFYRRYNAWVENEKVLIEGTMLEAVARDPLLMISVAQMEELKYFGIYTVEQLASVSDSNAQKFMGINELKKRARTYLEASEKKSATTRLHAELEKRDNEIASLKEAMRAQQAQMAKLMEKLTETPEEA